MKLKSPLTIQQVLRNYTTKKAKSDLIAGLSTGMLFVPQAMAYAVIAGIPVEYGLYAALIAPLVYLIFGTSSKLVLGPAALDSMLLASSLALITTGFSQVEYLNYVFATVLLTGCFQLLFSFLRLGFISNFFSKPLLSGFTTAAAILIAFSQLKNILGVGLLKTPFLHQFLLSIVKHASQINYTSLSLGLTTIIILGVLKKTKFNKVGTPIIVLLGIAIQYFLKLNIAVIGKIPKGLPSSLPFNLSDVHFFDIIIASIVLAIIGFTISMSISKSVEKDPNAIKSNKELFALGSANIIGGLFGGYQASSSFSRTAINKASGAATRVSNIASSVVILVVLLYFTNLFELLPLSILGGVIVSAMPSLMKLSDFKTIYKLNKREFLVLLMTFITTLELGVLYGLAVGMLISGGVFFFQTLEPHIAVLGQIGKKEIFRNILRFDSAKEIDDHLIVRIDGAIYFANIKFVLTSIQRLIEERPNVKYIILHAQAIHYIDITALYELELFIKKQNKKTIEVYIAAVQGPLRDLFFEHNFHHLLGGQQLFLNLPSALAFTSKGYISPYKNNIANQFDHD